MLMWYFYFVPSVENFFTGKHIFGKNTFFFPSPEYVGECLPSSWPLEKRLCKVFLSSAYRRGI